MSVFLYYCNDSAEINEKIRSNWNNRTFVFFDGFWPSQPIDENENVTIIHYTKAVGCDEAKKHVSKLIDNDSINNDLTIVYYTSNSIDNKLAKNVMDNIKGCSNGARIISVSQKPMDFGENICVGNIGKSLENIYYQMGLGVKKVNTKYVALCEDDCLYTSDHFLHRPQNISYNLNRWCLHEDLKVFSYRNHIVLSQLISPTSVLIDWINARKDVQVPKSMAGEPGRFERKLGIREFQIDKFMSDKPNIVVCHSKNTSGRKYIGKDSEPKKYLEPWGNSEELLKKLFERKTVRGKRSQHSYIKNKTFRVKDLIKNRMLFVYPGKEKSLEWFSRTFPQFIAKVHSGASFTNDDFRKEPYYDYLKSRLHPADRDPLTKKGERRVFQLMQDAIAVYHDIKKIGLKSPLDMWRHGDRLVLYRGGRRLEILHILGYEKVAARIFKTKQAFRNLNPSTEWNEGNPDNSIHGIAVKQFLARGDKATDKYWVHGYTPIYDKEIGHMRKIKRTNVLEIGVKRGASLELWRDAFPFATVYGIDIDERVKNLGLPFEIFIGSQDDRKFLKTVGEKIGKFHLIVDDGSHRPDHQLISFEELWPFVTSKGVYVIEDLHWNYRADKDKSMINKCKSMVDRIYENPNVLSVNFYYNICFIRKV